MFLTVALDIIPHDKTRESVALADARSVDIEVLRGTCGLNFRGL